MPSRWRKPTLASLGARTCTGVKIQHLGILRDYTGTGLRQTEGMARCIYGKEGAPDHTTLCRRLNSMGVSNQAGAAVLCNHGRTLILTADSTGLGMAKSNGWRYEKHGGKRGYLLLHTIADEATGRLAASKLTAPEDGDAPQFTDLIESPLRKSGLDPEKRREEVRRLRADLAAGKTVILSRNDGIADTSPEAAAKIAAAVEMALAQCPAGGGSGTASGGGGGGGGGGGIGGGRHGGRPPRAGGRLRPGRPATTTGRSKAPP